MQRHRQQHAGEIGFVGQAGVEQRAQVGLHAAQAQRGLSQAAAEARFIGHRAVQAHRAHCGAHVVADDAGDQRELGVVVQHHRLRHVTQAITLPVGGDVHHTVDRAAAHRRLRGLQAWGLRRDGQPARRGHAAHQLARGRAMVFIDDGNRQARGNAGGEHPQQQQQRRHRKPQQQPQIPGFAVQVSKFARQHGAQTLGRGSCWDRGIAVAVTAVVVIATSTVSLSARRPAPTCPGASLRPALAAAPGPRRCARRSRWTGAWRARWRSRRVG